MNKFLFILVCLFMHQTACAGSKVLLIADPKVLAIELKENREPMVDLRKQTELAFGPSPEVPNNTDYTFIRKTVYNKLLEAQKKLPKGLKLCLYEGHRSLGLQQNLFDSYQQSMREKYPSYSEEQIFLETMKLVSPVINLDGTKNVPPHSTGAAVDVYLIDDNGEILDMGIAAKDWAQDLDGSISATDSTKVSKQAQEYRKIMSKVLTEVGFVNYPTEYWHWSYGDKYWAYNKNQPFAFYGTLPPQESS